MHYLVFLPEVSGGDPLENLSRAGGLESLCRQGDQAPAFADLEGPGPGGRLGQLITWRKRGEPLAYEPDSQTWWECLPDPDRGLPAGRYWYGVWRFDRPLPADLERSDGWVPGHDVTLGDGELWTIPNVMNLPHRYGFDRQTGRRELIVLRDFEEIAARAAWALQALEAHAMHELDQADGQPIDWKAGVEYCEEMLAINYRLTPEIAAWLELFDESNVHQVMARSVDFDRLAEVLERLKKKDLTVTQDSS